MCASKGMILKICSNFYSKIMKKISQQKAFRVTYTSLESVD